MTNSKIERQLQLEDESVGLGIKAYRDKVREAQEKGQEAELPPVIALMNTVVIPLSQQITGWIEQNRQARGGSAEKREIIKFLDSFDPDQLAFITARTILQGASNIHRLQKVSLDIVSQLEDELSYISLKEEAPGLYRKVIRQTARSTSYRHRRAVMQVAAQRAGYDWKKPLVHSSKLKAGSLLVDLFITATGLVEVGAVSAGRRTSNQVVKPTQLLLDWLEKQHARYELLSPTLVPMVCRPDDWTTPFNGGYLNKQNTYTKLIKTRNHALLEELSNSDLTPVYRAVNALQRTAWRINSPVLEVMQQVWDEGGNLGGLPSREETPLPAKPADIENNPESLKQWKQAAAKVYEENARAAGKRLAVAQKLEVARKFRAEEEIYYPWQLDWRGRAYPMVTTQVHPQADDSGKALLQFAEGKRLGESGGYWLAVHIANLFGVDKVSFDERVQWVQDNTELLMDSAMFPLDGQRFWAQADKPYNALAACFEWLGFQMEGEDYVSHLPVAMDGSCNGLQNFSAMLRDEVGGKAVNLVPSDEPQDIYMEVANVVDEKVTEALHSDDPKEQEMGWAWTGKITRSLVKRPVMTLPYGATRPGMRDQMIDTLKEFKDKQQLDKLPVSGKDREPVDDFFPHCHWLSGVVYDAIGEVVIAAREAMDWLQEVAKVVAKNGLPINWTTPVGLPILQRYVKTKGKSIECRLGMSRYKLRLNEETSEIDSRQMSQGIAPNFVHSLDASHMMLTVLYSLENDLTAFSMVHDSYATHAADCDKMYVLLRQAFVDMYQGDVLQEFLEQVQEQLPDELIKELPPVPGKGNLELGRVMDSEYFFA